MKSLPKKVMLLQGTPVEIGQSLTNLYGQNPDFKLIEQISCTSAREIKQVIATTSQPQYEAILIIIIVYENPTDLVGMEFVSTSPIKGNLKN